MTGYAQKNTGEALDITGVRLLLAEDNKLNQEIIETFLRDEGALVKIVSDGQQAVEEFGRCKEGTYDAILMDVMMPKLDGMTATRLIRAMDREDARVIPIIAMTANAFDEDRKKALECGMDGFLTKPIVIEELIGTLQKI